VGGLVSSPFLLFGYLNSCLILIEMIRSLFGLFSIIKTHWGPRCTFTTAPLGTSPQVRWVVAERRFTQSLCGSGSRPSATDRPWAVVDWGWAAAGLLPPPYDGDDGADRGSISDGSILSGSGGCRPPPSSLQWCPNLEEVMPQGLSLQALTRCLSFVLYMCN
jgi:hypothetical protein